MSNIKTGQPCPKMAKIEEFKSSLRQGAIKIGAPLEIAQTACGSKGAVITIDSAAQDGEKFSVVIDWRGGDSKAWAKFIGARVADYHDRLETVLDCVRNKVFDLAMAISLGNAIIAKSEQAEDPENRVVFEVTKYRFTAEQFCEELKDWEVQGEIIDGLLWIKEKDLSVAYEAAKLFEQQLHDWDPADWDEEDE
jgi:hypothetical protein